MSESEPKSVGFRDVVAEAILGSFDGVVSIVGIVYSGLLIHASNHTIATIGLGAAISATVSMTDGVYEASFEDPKRLRRLKALAMLVATLVGSLVPIWPFWVFDRTTSLVIGGIGCLLVATWIGQQKRRGWRGYVRSYVSLVAASGLTLLVVAVIPGAAG